MDIYGPNRLGEVDNVLGELDDIKARWNMPWVLGRDFNLIQFSHELNGDHGLDAKMDKFVSFIDRWRLIDGPIKGASFTWSSFQEVPSLSRLDRYFFCNEWDELFPGRIQSALPQLASNHRPILLESFEENWGLNPFKFEEHWFQSKDFLRLLSMNGTRSIFQDPLVGALSLSLNPLSLGLLPGVKRVGETLKC